MDPEKDVSSSKLRAAMLAAYAELQNDRPETAKTMLRVGLLGGSVNNSLDIERLNKEWLDKYAKK